MEAQDRIEDLLDKSQIGKQVNVYGWVRTFRNNQFLALNDGSCIQNLQLVVNDEVASEDVKKKINTGASIQAKGTNFRFK
jgi:asparaginyl-tRNA synthetase